MDITLEQAEKIVAAAKTKAKEIDTLMNIAVVDRGAHPRGICKNGRCMAGLFGYRHKESKNGQVIRYKYGRYRRIIATWSLPVQY